MTMDSHFLISYVSLTSHNLFNFFLMSQIVSSQNSVVTKMPPPISVPDTPRSDAAKKLDKFHLSKNKKRVEVDPSLLFNPNNNKRKVKIYPDPDVEDISSESDTGYDDKCNNNSIKIVDATHVSAENDNNNQVVHESVVENKDILVVSGPHTPPNTQTHIQETKNDTHTNTNTQETENEHMDLSLIHI